MLHTIERRRGLSQCHKGQIGECVNGSDRSIEADISDIIGDVPQVELVVVAEILAFSLPSCTSFPRSLKSSSRYFQ